MQKYNFKLTCSKFEEYIEIQDNVSLIIECVNTLSPDGFIYIYDMDTQTRFMIEIYDNKYALSIMNYYRDFEKDELIEFLNQGIKIFKDIYKNPEKEGFVWEDDGGL